MSDQSDIEQAARVVGVARRLVDQLRVGVAEMDALGELGPEALEALEAADRNTVYAFLKRFENAVEGGRRLFRALLVMIDDHDPTYSLIDVLNRAEKLGALASARAWRDAIEARNRVIHEYSMTPEEAATAIARARAAAAIVVELLAGALTAAEGPRFRRWRTDAER